MMVSKIGEQGQLKLQQASVLIVGMGGLGNPMVAYLGSAGLGKLVLVDGDDIDYTNLQRQVLFTEQDVGANKAETLQQFMQNQNSAVDIEVVDEMLDEELAEYYIPQVDVVIDCTDNIETRYLLNRLCVSHKVPLIVGAATGFDGQHMVVNSNEQDNACYECLFPSSQKAPIVNCQTVGIVGPVLSIIAGMQALHTIKLITGLPVKYNTLFAFDGMDMQWQQFTIGKQESCPICNQ
ncbi:HesA/MoeB/ThiF family protein [Thalassotalea agarivorans]|nr:HesA/MoeB/ThiF family protein [Thalassotalea agarivorans]